MKTIGISNFSFPVASGLIVALGALSVLLGATALTIPLVAGDASLHWGGAETQHVSALAFMLYGLTLIAAMHGRHAAAAGCAALLLLLVAIAVSPQLFRLYADLEQPYLLQRAAPLAPWGMTPFSALAFGLAGIGLLALAGKATRTAGCIIGGLTGASVLVLAGGELLSVLADLHVLIDWKVPAGQSAYSATGHTLLGLGLTLQAFRRAPGEATRPFRLLAAIILAGTLALTLLLWHGLNQAEQEQRSQRADTETLWLGKQFRAALLERINAMDRMAQRWEAGAGTPQPLWRLDAAAYINSLEGLQSMLWIDAGLQPRWAMPESSGSNVLDLYRQQHGDLQVLHQAQQTGTPMFSRQIMLEQGVQGILLVRAVTVAGRLDGYLVAVFVADGMFSSLSADIAARGFSLDIAQDQAALYRTGLAPARPDASGLARNYQLNGLGGSDWLLSLRPTEQFPGGTAMPGLVLASGLTLALLLGIIFRFWEASLKSALRQRLAATVYENCHEAIIITDADHKIISVNQAYTEITGYASHEVIGRNPRIVPSGRHDASFYRAMWASIGQNGYWTGEIWNKRKNGEIYPGILSITAVRDGQGKVQHYIGMFLDISDRKNAENALDEIARHTQAILDNVAEGIVTADSEGVIKSFNLAAERIFGYSPKTIIGRNVHVLMPESYRARHDRNVHQYVGSGAPRIIGLSREVQGQRADGSRFPAEIVVSEIDRDKQLLFIGLVRDITARKQTEQALIAAKELAERASLAKSQFLSAMSHELRTPMNAVLGFAQLMEIDDSLSPANKESVEQILKAGRHLLTLINDVLDLSKIESGSIELTLAPVACDELVGECLAMVTPLAQEQGIQVSYDDMDGVSVCADRLYLKQSLINLLSNAIKYNRPDGSVHVRLEPQENDRICLAVSDTGYGIAPELLPRIFQPFERLETTPHLAAIEGTGIGLSICKRLIEAMNGDITVDSTPGSGSVFRIILPAAQAPDSAAHTPTLLYFESSPANLQMLQKTLAQHMNLQIIGAPMTENGIKLAQTMRPDLILLDSSPEDAGSPPPLHQLREHPATRDIPVIACTVPSGIQQVLDAGFDDYVTHPMNRDHLLRTIQRHLERSPNNGARQA